MGDLEPLGPPYHSGLYNGLQPAASPKRGGGVLRDRMPGYPQLRYLMFGLQVPAGKRQEHLQRALAR